MLARFCVPASACASIPKRCLRAMVRIPLPVERMARRLSPGESLFQEGDPGDSMFVMQSGRVRVFRKIGKTEVTLANLGPGELFGEMAVLEGLPRTATAVAAEPTVVVELNRKVFEDMIRENGEIGLRILRKLSGRLREADQKIDTFLTASSETSTVELLRGLAQGDSKDWRSLGPDFDLSALAQLAGVSLNEAHRMEQSLRLAGVLDGTPPAVRLAPDSVVDDFLEYLALRQRYDPLSVSELAGITGVSEEEAHQIVERLLAARLVAGEGGRSLIDSYQLYLRLKRRFEYSNHPR
jgi:CRP/FNR family transcriptional regulator, cyclic AMP receptor protein